MNLGSGEQIIDRLNSHVHGNVNSFLEEAFARILSGNRQFFTEEVDLGRPIGETICVSTTSGDQIVWAQRPKRFGHSRFVKNRKPEPCNAATVVLKKDDREDYYVLITAFVGRRAEPEPWDQRSFLRQLDPAEAERRSREFWGLHALVWGSEPTVPGTETTVCPW